MWTAGLHARVTTADMQRTKKPARKKKHEPFLLMEPFVGWEPFARGPTTGAVQEACGLPAGPSVQAYVKVVQLYLNEEINFTHTK